MADAVTRSHLGDGRVVGWYGDPGTVIDAEIRGAEPPHLVERFGAEDFLGRWTRAECAAKLADVPMQVWLVAPRARPRPERSRWQTHEVDDLVISVCHAAPLACEISTPAVPLP